MLPFQIIEPPPPIGMSPAEAAHRQRQRMLQAGVFVCCLLLLLDTRGTAQQRMVKLESSSAKGSADSTALEAAKMRARLDDAIRATRLRSSSTAELNHFANVTGLYQGEWRRITSGNESRKQASRLPSNKGVAVVHLEMMSVEGFSELSAARALVSLADENGSSDKAGTIFASAFGIYLHSLGRLIMIANVGNPTKDSVELRVWPSPGPKARRNATEVQMWSGSHRRNNGMRSNQSKHSARQKLSWASDRIRRRLAAEDSAYTTTRTATITAFGIVEGLVLELAVEGRVDVSARPTKRAEASATKRTGVNFTLDPEPPLQRIFAANKFNASAHDNRKDRAARSDEGSSSPLSDESRSGTGLVIEHPLAADGAIRAKGTSRGRDSHSRSGSPPISFGVGDFVLMGGDPAASSAETGGSVQSAFTLKPDRRFAYPTRPIFEDVWKHARCPFAVDLEEDPTQRKVLPPGTTERRVTDQLALRLAGTISGCGLSIAVDVRANRIDWDAARRAALGYSLLMTSMCVVQIALLFRQLHFSRTQAVAARVSLICIAAQSLIDAVLCVANLLLCAAVQNLFAAFASVAFFELIIFCVVEMRYVVVVFQAHDPQRFWLGASTRRQLAILHAQFYLALFASLCAVYICRDDVRLVAFVAYSFWLPQIVRNARHEYTQPFHDSYLYGMALSRLVAPLYVYAYPYSLVSVIVPNAKLRPLFCLVLFAWQAVQVALLKAQAQFGPRFFIPRCFLPARYNYRRPLPPLPPQRQRHADQALHTLAARTTAYRHAPSPADSLGRGNAAASASANSVALATEDDLPDESRAERGFECVICFQDVLPSGRNHLITPCDHVRLSSLSVS